MQDIRIGRFDQDPQAQGVIRPADDSWQLVIDKEGYPHLYVRMQIEDSEEGEPTSGLMCIEDLMDTTIPDLMKSTAGGRLSPEEEAEAYQEYLQKKEATKIPCPR